MEEQYLWEEQLKKFKQAYLSKGTSQQYINYLQERGIDPDKVKEFIPREAEELITANNNIQYHLNGRVVYLVYKENGF